MGKSKTWQVLSVHPFQLCEREFRDVPWFASHPLSFGGSGGDPEESGMPTSSEHHEVLRVGSIISLTVKNSEDQHLPVGTYLKHDLVAVGPLRTAVPPEGGFLKESYQVYLADTSETQKRWGTPVYFDEDIILMDGAELGSQSTPTMFATTGGTDTEGRGRRVWNFQNTGAWGSGYVAPRSPETPGVLILRILEEESMAGRRRRHSNSNSRRSVSGGGGGQGRPVPLEKFGLVLEPSNVRGAQPLSIYRRSTSALAGGYLVTDGSGVIAKFRFQQISRSASSDPKEEKAAEEEEARSHWRQQQQQRQQPEEEEDRFASSRRSDKPPLRDLLQLHYGESVRFLVTPPPPVSSRPAENWIGNYVKHSLVAAGPCDSAPHLFAGEESGFTLWPTSEVMMNDDSMEYLTGVTYNQPLMIVDGDTGLRWNTNTKTWHSGYLTLQDLDEPGGVCISLHRKDLPYESRQPVRFGDKGVYIAVHRPGYPPRRASLYRSRGSALHPDGGYLVIDGSGVEFEVTVCRAAEDDEQAVNFARDMEDEKEDPDSKQASPLSSIAIFYGVLTLYWIDALFKRIFGGSKDPISYSLVLLNLLLLLAGILLAGVCFDVPQLVQHIPPAVLDFLELNGIPVGAALSPHIRRRRALSAVSLDASGDGEEKTSTKAGEEGMEEGTSAEKIYRDLIVETKLRREKNQADLARMEQGDASVIVPPRFVRAEKDDPPKQRQRYLETLRWRSELEVDTILLRPHPHFELIKSCSTQVYHKTDRKGQIIYIERPKDIDLGKLKANKIGMPDLLHHYRYITEFLWQVLDKNEDDGRIFTILDLKGIGLTDFVGEVIDFTKQVSSMTQAHYPERTAYIFLVNASWTFNAIWKLVKTFLSKETLEKTHVFRSGHKKELLKFIAPENLPVEYGGTCECPGGCLKNSPAEREMAEFCAYVNERGPPPSLATEAEQPGAS